MSIDIKDLTLRDLEKLKSLINQESDDFDNEMIGEKVIIRTYSAGVHYGTLYKKKGTEVYLKNARRMHRFKAKKSIALSGVAKYGLDLSASIRICGELPLIHLNSIEIIPVSDACIKSFEECPEIEAEK